jgi:hypothetical protein
MRLRLLLLLGQHGLCLSVILPENALVESKPGVFVHDWRYVGHFFCERSSALQVSHAHFSGLMAGLLG